jgi:Lon protease-like protein
MTPGAVDASFDTLPATLPIFPLPGALLLPGGKLPLQIFEPRYLAMTRDALASERMIGMVQPRDQASEARGPVSHTATLYPIGCAGRITSFSETDDGRLLITLTGLCRFAIEREIPTVGGYRRVVPDFGRFRADLDRAETATVDRARMLTALQTYFASQKINVDLTAIAEVPDDKLVTSLAMVCPFDANEKQAILEAADLTERSRVMTALLELSVFSVEGEGARH